MGKDTIVIGLNVNQVSPLVMTLYVALVEIKHFNVSLSETSIWSL